MYLEKGGYYIGDPCYPFDHKTWIDLLNKTNYFDHIKGNDSYSGSYHGHKLIVFGIEFGDGRYYDNKHNHYDVDAGCICIMPKEMLEKFGDKERIKSLRIVKFDNNFTAYCNKRHIRIDDIFIDVTSG